MQRSLPVSVAVLLAACGVAATISNDAAESATQSSGKAKQRQRVGFESFDRGGMAGCFDPNLSGHARAAAERIGGVPCSEASTTSAAGNDPWIGEYEGPAVEGMTAGVSITRGSGPNRYQVRVEVGGPGCGGQIAGTGVAANNRMTLIESVPDRGEQCRIQLDRNGATLAMDENGGCHTFHGAQCRFEGRVTRQGSGRAATGTNAPTGQMPWLVGGWVERGQDCDGEGWIVEEDGSYIDLVGAGRWSLSGDTLILTQLQRQVPGADFGQHAPVRNPRPVREQIIARTPSAFSMRHPNGAVSRWVRCR